MFLFVSYCDRCGFEIRCTVLRRTLFCPLLKILLSFIFRVHICLKPECIKNKSLVETFQDLYIQMGYSLNTLRDEWTKEILEPIPRLGTQQLNRGSGVNSRYIFCYSEKKHSIVVFFSSLILQLLSKLLIFFLGSVIWLFSMLYFPMFEVTSLPYCQLVSGMSK